MTTTMNTMIINYKNVNKKVDKEKYFKFYIKQHTDAYNFFKNKIKINKGQLIKGQLIKELLLLENKNEIGELINKYDIGELISLIASVKVVKVVEIDEKVVQKVVQEVEDKEEAKEKFYKINMKINMCYVLLYNSIIKNKKENIIKNFSDFNKNQLDYMEFLEEISDNDIDVKFSSNIKPGEKYRLICIEIKEKYELLKYIIEDYNKIKI